MRRTIAGFVAGVLVAGGVGLSAQNNGNFIVTAKQYAFVSVATWLDYPTTYPQGGGDMVAIGYATGVIDTLTAVNAYILASPNSLLDDAKRLQETQNCLLARNKNAGALQYNMRAALSKKRATAPDENAALVALFAACE